MKITVVEFQLLMNALDERFTWATTHGPAVVESVREHDAEMATILYDIVAAAQELRACIALRKK